jgi:hypothetical protein
MLQARIAPPWNSVGWGFIGIGLALEAVASFIRAKTTINALRAELEGA